MCSASPPKPKPKEEEDLRVLLSRDAYEDRRNGTGGRRNLIGSRGAGAWTPVTPQSSERMLQGGLTVDL